MLKFSNINITLILGVVLMCSACSDDSDQPTQTITIKPPALTESTARTQRANKKTNPESFKLVLEQPKHKSSYVYYDLFQSNRRIHDVVDGFNELFNLPKTITIRLWDEPEPTIGPHYNIKEKSVNMSYEFLSITQKLFEIYEDDIIEEYNLLEDKVIDNFEFALYHELAHALIDVLELPVIGPEEDAADALAIIILTTFLENAEHIALAAAELFMVTSEIEVSDSDFWGEHSLDIKRFYNINCWLYGSAPKQFLEIMKSLDVSDTRMDRCVDNFNQLQKSWLKLLKPNLNLN